MLFSSSYSWGAVTDTLPYRNQILDTAELVNDYWIAHNDSGNSGWARAAYYTGNQRLYELTANPDYLEHAVKWGSDNSWLRGPEGDFHADAHCCGQTYIDLYRIDQQAIRIQDIVRALDLNVESPLVDRWHWIDAFYMAAPTLAKLAVIQEDSRYTEKLWDMYQDMGWRRGLFDEEAGLWYRDANWFYPAAQSKNGKKVFWSRGNGWVIAGIARVLSELPQDHPRRNEFVSMLQTMAAALAPLQGDDGFWRSSLLDPDDVPNPEASGTGFFAYAMAWGIRMGYLDSETYLPIVTKAWNGLNEIAVHPDGFLGYVQTPDDSPAGADFNVTRDYGVGAFLLASSELSLLAEEAPFELDAGSAQKLVDWDGDGSSRVELSGTIIAEVDLVDTALTWWIGNELIAYGQEALVELPVGNHRVTLYADVGSKPAVTDSTAVVILPGASSTSVSAPDFQEPNKPENVFDGNLDTRLSIEGIGKQIVFSLSFPVQVRALYLAFYFGDERIAYFDIEASGDGTHRSPVLTDLESSGLTLDLQRFAFNPVEAQYLRIIGNGNSASLWNSYTEALIEFTPLIMDADEDGLPDIWELNYLGSTRHAGDEIFNQVGISLRDAYQLTLDPMMPLRSQFWMSQDLVGNVLLHFEGLPVDSPGYTESSGNVIIERSMTLQVGSWEYFADANNSTQIEIPANPGPTFYRLTKTE